MNSNGDDPDSRPIYPDTSDILACKAEGRRDLARLTFDEKIARMERLRERLAPFKALRQARIQDRQGGT